MNIKNWEELSKLPDSETHHIELQDNCSAFLIRISDGKYDYYLSTHTFYGGDSTKNANEILVKCSFDAVLIGREDDD